MLLIDTAPAGDGAEDARFGVLRGGNLGEIVRKDDEIRVLAGFQLAFLSILERRVGGTGGVSADAILEQNFLLRLPTVSRTAIRAFARDAGVQPAKRTDGLDGIIRAEGEPDAIFLHGGPGVGADVPLAADAVVGRAHVGGVMPRLHGGNDAALRKTGEIHGRDDLCVLDAVAAVARAVGFGDRFENVEGYAIGAIADSVESKLETSLVALDGHRREVLRIAGEDSTRGGIVGIRLEHRRSARTHSSIRESFQRTGL